MWGEDVIQLCQFLFFTHYVNPLIGTIMPISVPLSNVYHQFAMNSA
jgi:hypothetical protein